MRESAELSAVEYPMQQWTARVLELLAVACMSFTPRFAGAGAPVTLGIVTWIGYGPIYCAAANGYYKKYGLDVKLINFSDDSVMAGAGQCGESGATTLNYDP